MLAVTGCVHSSTDLTEHERQTSPSTQHSTAQHSTAQRRYGVIPMLYEGLDSLYYSTSTDYPWLPLLLLLRSCTAPASCSKAVSVASKSMHASVIETPYANAAFSDAVFGAGCHASRPCSTKQNRE